MPPHTSIHRSPSGPQCHKGVSDIARPKTVRLQHNSTRALGDTSHQQDNHNRGHKASMPCSSSRDDGATRTLRVSKGRCAPGTNALSRGTARYSTRSQQHRINRGVPSSIYPITSFSFPVYIGYVSFLNQDFPHHIARRDENPTCTVYVYTARDDIPSARYVYA